MRLVLDEMSLGSKAQARDSYLPHEEKSQEIHVGQLRFCRKSLTLDVATCLADLSPLAGKWKDLWENDPDTTPFQSTAWLLAYVRAFRPAVLRILLVRRRDKLIGIFPFVVENSCAHRVLRILGGDLSDYLDGLCREEDRAEVSELVEIWLAEQLRHCDCAEFAQLRPNAVLRSSIEKRFAN